jgi:hypothetical protein
MAAGRRSASDAATSAEERRAVGPRARAAEREVEAASSRRRAVVDARARAVEGGATQVGRPTTIVPAETPRAVEMASFRSDCTAACEEGLADAAPPHKSAASAGEERRMLVLKGHAFTPPHTPQSSITAPPSVARQHTPEGAGVVQHTPDASMTPTHDVTMGW